jgi:hypothetical protein
MSAVRGRSVPRDADTRQGKLEQEIERAVAAYDDAEFQSGLLRADLQAAEARRDAAFQHLQHLGELADAQGIAYAVPVKRADESTPRSPEPVSRRSDRELSGAALREASIHAALKRGEVRRPVHHTQWLAWLRADGYEPAGKKPENVFLTQLGRSPLVVRAEQPGCYVLEPGRILLLQDAIRSLHEQFAALPSPDQLSMLGDDARRRRQQLQTEIARAERLLHEGWRMLSLVAPPDAAPSSEDDEDWPARAWLRK